MLYYVTQLLSDSIDSFFDYIVIFAVFITLGFIIIITTVGIVGLILVITKLLWKVILSIRKVSIQLLLHQLKEYDYITHDEMNDSNIPIKIMAYNQRDADCQAMEIVICLKKENSITTINLATATIKLTRYKLFEEEAERRRIQKMKKATSITKRNVFCQEENRSYLISHFTKSKLC